MRVTSTAISEVLILEPKVFEDSRGFFFESYNRQRFQDAVGVGPDFVQDNHSRSVRGVLRGIHYQVRQPQGKLVWVIAGEVFDVAVDLRRSSPTFGQWVGVHLSAENKRQIWIPEGFGHAFLVLSEHAEFLYKTTNYYSPSYERTILWSDPDLNITWTLPANHSAPILSAKDCAGKPLREAEVFD